MASIVFMVTDVLAKLAASARRTEPVNLPKVAVQTGLNAVSEIIESELGRPTCISRCFNLPTDGFTSGKANEEKNSGVADAVVMTSAPLAQLCVKEKKVPGDFIGLNKVAVHFQYQATHEMRRKDSSNKKTSLKLVKRIRLMMEFGIPTKPCTPVYSLLAHKHQDLLLKEATRARHVPKRHVDKNINDTRVSQLVTFQPEVDIAPLWHRPKFEQNIHVELKVTVQKLKMELVERQELLINAPNAVEALAQYCDTQIKQRHVDKNNDDTRLSRLGKFQPEVDIAPPWHRPKFEQNIHVELKVTVETLKTELVERQELLIKAPNVMKALAKYSGTQIKQLKEEFNEELREIREGYETKLKGMKKDLRAAKHVMVDMVEKLAETANLNQQLNEKLLESTDRFHEDQRQLQVAMKAKLDERDRMIDELTGALVSTQRDNKELRNQLYDKEQEQQLNSRSLVDDSLSQNHTCKDDSTARDSELQQLQSKVEDLNQSLIETNIAAHTTERKWCQAFEEQAEVLKELEAKINALQSSVSAKDVELAESKQQSKEPSAAKQPRSTQDQKLSRPRRNRITPRYLDAYLLN